MQCKWVALLFVEERSPKIKDRENRTINNIKLGLIVRLLKQQATSSSQPVRFSRHPWPRNPWNLLAMSSNSAWRRKAPPCWMTWTFLIVSFRAVFLVLPCWMRCVRVFWFVFLIRLLSEFSVPDSWEPFFNVSGWFSPSSWWNSLNFHQAKRDGILCCHWWKKTSCTTWKEKNLLAWHPPVSWTWCIF